MGVSALVKQRWDVPGAVQHAHDLDGGVDRQVEHEDLAEASHGTNSHALESRIVQVPRAAEGWPLGEGGERPFQGFQEPKRDRIAGLLSEVPDVSIDVTVALVQNSESRPTISLYSQIRGRR